MVQLINEAVAGRLLEAVSSIGSCHVGLAERRQALLNGLCDLLDADAAFWAWGHGRPESGSITPIAQFTRGFSEPALVKLATWAFSADAQQNFTLRISARMQGDMQVTTRRLDIVPEIEWSGYLLRALLNEFGFENWLHSVRYSNDDTWSNFFLTKNIGKADFSDDEISLLDICLKYVSWAHSHIEHEEVTDSFPSLTARQKSVMLMLLEGYPRKQIALNLSISEDTVGDHLKNIYALFDVNSSNELAARFLRSR